MKIVVSKTVIEKAVSNICRWSLWWHIEMDGYMPARYDLIDGEFIKRI